MTSQWGVYPPLLEDVDDPVGDLELIEHVRQTGALYSDELGSGVQSTGPWYNPAPLQRKEHLYTQQLALAKEAHQRRHRIEQLSKVDRLDKIRAEYAALEAWRAHQDEMSAHMRMARRYAEMLRVG